MREFNDWSITCLGLAPPRRTSNKVAHKLSVCGNLNNLSDITEKSSCNLELTFLLFSERGFVLPTARLKNLVAFFSDGKPTKSLPINCKLSNLIGSYSLYETKLEGHYKTLILSHWFKTDHVYCFTSKQFQPFRRRKNIN